MSIEIMTEVWKVSRVKGNDLLLMLAIANYADEMGYCWPSIRTLAKRTRMSPRSVLRGIGYLRAERELYVIHGGSKGNKYAVVSGCSFGEAKRRIRHAISRGRLGDKLSSIGDKVSPTVFQNKRKPATESSVNPSINESPLREFWLSEIKTPEPGGTYFEKLDYRIETQGFEAVKAALIQANKYGKAHNIKYVDAILKDVASQAQAPSKPAEPKLNHPPKFVAQPKEICPPERALEILLAAQRAARAK